MQREVPHLNNFRFSFSKFRLCSAVYAEITW